MPRIHHLKSWPESFQAVVANQKTHEIRNDDRGFMEDDFLCLHEWDPGAEVRLEAMDPAGPPLRLGAYTGREFWVKVKYKTPGGSWGLPPGLCVLSVWPAGEPTEEPE